MGFPNAYIGLLGYLILAGFATYRELVGGQTALARLTVTLGFAATVIGWLASLGLTYIATYVIKAECLWCLTSAAIMTLSMFTAAWLAQKADTAWPPPRDALASFLAPILAVLAIGGVIVIGVNLSGIQKRAGDERFNLNVLMPPGSHVKNPDGVVTLVEFGDLDCPVCKRIYPLVEDRVRKSNGRLRYVFHNFPLWTNREHRGALVGAIISEMAADQGKFWNYLDMCYSGPYEQGAPLPGNSDMIDFGKAIGMDPALINKRLSDDNDSSHIRVTADLGLAAKLGIISTPTFVILAEGKPAWIVVGKDALDLLDTPEYKQLLNQ